MSRHAHSSAALSGEIDSGALSRRAALIVEAARRWPAPGVWTDRQMCWALSLSDMNAVRPRITELVSQGFLVEAGSTVCPSTGKTVRLCRIATPAEVRDRAERAARARLQHAVQGVLFE